MQIEPPPLPRPPDGTMTACPQGLPDARDATRDAVLAARAATARQYADCRARHGALRDYVRDIRETGESAE